MWVIIVFNPYKVRLAIKEVFSVSTPIKEFLVPVKNTDRWIEVPGQDGVWSGVPNGGVRFLQGVFKEVDAASRPQVCRKSAASLVVKWWKNLLTQPRLGLLWPLGWPSTTYMTELGLFNTLVGSMGGFGIFRWAPRAKWSLESKNMPISAVRFRNIWVADFANRGFSTKAPGALTPPIQSRWAYWRQPWPSRGQDPF